MEFVISRPAKNGPIAAKQKQTNLEFAKSQPKKV